MSNEFLGICKAATERVWVHRHALRRVAVRIGFWPDGLVISASINFEGLEQDLRASLLAEQAERKGPIAPAPRTIPWDRLAVISEEELTAAVDDYFKPIYHALRVS
jgi:hypothetical protein